MPRGVLDNDPEDDIGTWCYCKRAKGGQMIWCENKSCNTKWYQGAAYSYNSNQKDTFMNLCSYKVFWKNPCY